MSSADSLCVHVDSVTQATACACSLHQQDRLRWIARQAFPFQCSFIVQCQCRGPIWARNAGLAPSSGGEATRSASHTPPLRASDAHVCVFVRLSAARWANAVINTVRGRWSARHQTGQHVRWVHDLTGRLASIPWHVAPEEAIPELVFSPSLSLSACGCVECVASRDGRSVVSSTTDECHGVVTPAIFVGACLPASRGAGAPSSFAPSSPPPRYMTPAATPRLMGPHTPAIKIHKATPIAAYAVWRDGDYLYHIQY